MDKLIEFVTKHWALIETNLTLFGAVFLLGVILAFWIPWWILKQRLADQETQLKVRGERIDHLKDQIAHRTTTPPDKDRTDDALPSAAKPIKVDDAAAIIQTSGNPLRDAIDAFLAKNGRKANYGLQATVAMRDDSDGRGPYIGAWDASSLGLWPTTTDGFTEHQLKRLPIAPVKYRSQTAKDRLADALDEITILLNASKNEIVKAYEKFHRAWVAQSHAVATGKVDPALMIESLQELTTAMMMMNRGLYAEDGLLRKYEIDAEELSSILKQDKDNNASTFAGHAASRLRDGISVLDSIVQPRSLEAMMIRVLPHVHAEYDLEMQKFLRWMSECNVRSDMLRSALR